MEAVKTIAFELTEGAILTGNTLADAISIPVGGGGLYTSVWKGFQVLSDKGMNDQPPQIVAVQAEGSSNIVRAWWRKGSDLDSDDATTLNSGLQVAKIPRMVTKF